MNIYSFFGLISIFVLMYILWKLARKNVDFGLRNILAVVMGIILGVIFPNKMSYIESIVKIYVNFTTALIVPLVFVSIISNLASLKDFVKNKKPYVNTLFWLILNMLTASIIAILFALLFNLGVNLEIGLNTVFISDLPIISDLFPSNFIKNLGSNEILPIVIFSIILGVGIINASKKDSKSVEEFKKVILSFQSILNYILSFVFSLVPYIVLALTTVLVSRFGALNILSLINIFISSYLACIVQLFIVSGLLIFVVARLNPITFFRKIFKCIVAGFTSQSSFGTLPITTKYLIEKVGLDEEITNFVAPLSCSMGMVGCAVIWPITLILTAIHSLNINYSLLNYIFLIFVIITTAIISVNIPGTATIVTIISFITLGLPIEVIIIVMPISSIVDMIRTATNVTTCATITTLVAKSHNKINLNIFNSK